MTRIKNASTAREHGTALVEFVVVFTILVPLLLGTIVIGLNLVRAIQVTEVCRDVGHMYAYGIDFSQNSNQDLATKKLAQGLNMTDTGGNGVIILSTVTYIDDCRGGGYTTQNGCPNYGLMVFTNRLTIGNPSLHASRFGSPEYMDANGNIPQGHVGGQDGYLNDPADVALPALSSTITLSQSGLYAYVSEMYTTSPDLDLWAYLNMTSPSAVSIF